MQKNSVLIVDDEYIIALDTKMTLEQNGFVVPGIAINADEAISLSQSHRPDLVLMDIVLGGRVDGIDAAKTILESGNTQVIFMSGNLEGENMKRIEKIPNSGFLSKPCTQQALLNAINFALRHYSNREDC